jgi:predicted permease
MGVLREWLFRLWGAVRRRRSDADLEQELRLHQDLAVEDARRHTTSSERVGRAAALRSGGMAHAMDHMRDQRGLPWLDDVMRDVRHAVRLLRRNPVFAAIAIASLAVGVGANCAIFSLADELFLRPLPVRDPAAVMTLSTDARDDTFYDGGMSYPNYLDLRDTSQSFDGLAAYRISAVSFARSPGAVRETHRGELVSDNFFRVLGVEPAIGRAFAPGEGHVPGRDAVVVLSDDFWRNTLGADPSILNAIVWMNGVAFQVIGVAPASFTGTEQPFRPAFYAPIAMAPRLGARLEDELTKRDDRAYAVKGRLKAGVSKARARAELDARWDALVRLYPEANRHRTIALRSELDERLREDPWDVVLMAIFSALAAVVLIIACANVANLMLGRARARSREMAVRLALGVSRGRLLRQLLTEAVVLAIAGFAAGLGLAYAGIRFLQTIPTRDQIVIAPQLDDRVLVFGLIVAGASAILFGLAPARQGLRTDLAPALKTSEPGDARTRIGGRHVLVVGQIAASMVLLVVIGILLDGFRKAVVLDPGFRTDHLMVMSTDTALVQDTAAQTRAFYRELVERARALPGVTSATLTSSVPFDVGDQHTEPMIPEGARLGDRQDSIPTSAAIVDERYFDTLQIRLVAGRGFTVDDRDGSRPVAIVNEELAKTYWPNQDPIGKRMRLAASGSPWLEIIGVTTTGKYTWIAETPTPFLYLPFAQHVRTRMSLLVETAGADAAPIAAPLRDVVRAIDVNQPVSNVQTFASLYHERAIAVPLMLMQTVGTIGLLGLALALIGLYGLIAYSVARRTREIGIRMAIGAGTSDVLAMVLREGLKLSIVGIAIGGVVSVWVVRALTAALVGVGAPNPATYVIVPAVLIALTLAASYAPARRAARVDPLVALRQE